MITLDTTAVLALRVILAFDDDFLIVAREGKLRVLPQ